MNNEIADFLQQYWHIFGNAFKRKVLNELGEDEYKKLFK